MSAKYYSYLIQVIQKLSLARELDEVIAITRAAARKLTGADGASFVLKDGDLCYYVDEDAIDPLWKGKKFPMNECISGWSMIHKKSVSIKNVFEDSRIPINTYRPTFVKSLLMVPIRRDRPIGAIGNYWAHSHEASKEEIHVLEALADSTSMAIENIQLYMELKKANEFLADSLKSKDEFFAIASHELRTPITAIKLQLELTDRKLRREGGLTQLVEGPLTVSLKQAEKLSTMTEQILDVSKMRLGKFQLEYSEFDCGELIERTITLYRQQLKAAGCRVQLSFDENVTGSWDYHAFEKILLNLLSNACRHAPGSNIQISLHKQEDRNIRFSLQDNGQGIPKDVLERLEQGFERSHAPRQLGGLGLGLFIVRSLVEAHEGYMNISSKVGEGTLCDISLPLRPRSSH